MEEVPDQLMSPIELLRIQAIELAHSSGKISFDGFDQKMIVICHLTKTMDDKVVPFAHVSKDFQPLTSVEVMTVDRIFPVAPRGDMVKSAREFESKRSCHVGNGTEESSVEAEIAQC